MTDKEPREGEKKEREGLVPVLVPMTSLIWGEGAPDVERPSPGISIDSLRSAAIGPELIDKIASDSKFREYVKENPVSALAEMGVTLGQEEEEGLTGALEENPDLLVKAMLGEEFPPLPTGLVAAIPAVIVGVQVGKYVAVGVVVAVGTKSEAVRPKDVAAALSKAAAGHETSSD